MIFLNRNPALLAFMAMGTTSTTFASWIDVEVNYAGHSCDAITVKKDGGPEKKATSEMLLEEKFELGCIASKTLETVSFKRTQKKFVLWLNPQPVKKGIEVLECVTQSNTTDFTQAYFIPVKPEEILLEKSLGKLVVYLTDDEFFFNFKMAQN